jgi:polyhydroxybutyrate depolymerase
MKKIGLHLSFAGLLVALAPLAGCPDNHSIDVDGITRTYLLYLPPASSGEPIPLVVALLPLFLDSRQMRLMTRFDKIAEREGFAVAYPDGIARQWDVVFGGEYDVKFLTALIDKLILEHNVDPERVYVTGASNGGMMCHLLACRAPDRIAAIAPVMGTPPPHVLDSCVCDRQMPVLIIHGTADAIVPYNGEPWDYMLPSVPATTEFWAEHNGCGGNPMTTPLPDTDPSDGTTVDLIEYTCGERAPVLLYRVNGGGHTWSGDVDYLPQLSWGRVSLDIDASEVIWSFFSTQTAGFRSTAR